MSDLSLEAQAQEDAKRLKRLKFLYPFYEFCGSPSKSYSTYVTFFYTNVYMFSVNFAATISLTSSLISWIGTPAFAAFVDGFKFKNAKYWPWILIGSVITNVGTMLIMCLPSLTGKTVELMYVVFLIRIIMTICGPLSATPISGVFPKMSKSPADRQYFGMSQKIGRDGGKTIFGYIVPAMLLALSGGADEPTMNGYAIGAIICYGLQLAGMWLFALAGLKGSYVEREAMLETEAKKNTKVPISATLKCIVGNRQILGMFIFFALHKGYYFIYTSYAAYVFRYVFQNFGAVGTFMTIFNLTAIIGVAFGGLWTKLWKESKRAFVMAFVMHIIFLVLMKITWGPSNMTIFMILFGCSSFFMGMLETWVLPNFASAADYGQWKTGTRMDTLTMACYTLSMTVCMMLTTIVATAFLNSFDYTGWLQQYNAGAVGITDAVVKGLGNLYTLAPLGMALLALCSILFIFTMTDDMLKKIQEDLKEGKTAATSEYKF